MHEEQPAISGDGKIANTLFIKIKSVQKARIARLPARYSTMAMSH